MEDGSVLCDASLMRASHSNGFFNNKQQPDAGDYSYSGMHDHGPLPAPREGGDVALLIGCVEATKRCSDEFLTDVIKKEKARSPNQKTGNDKKRSKKEI